MTDLTPSQISDRLTCWVRGIYDAANTFEDFVSVTNSATTPTGGTPTKMFKDLNLKAMRKYHIDTTWHKNGDRTMRFVFENGAKASIRFWLKPNITVIKS